MFQKGVKVVEEVKSLNSEIHDGFRCFNVVIGSARIKHQDLELFFGPFTEPTTILHLKDCNSQANLLKILGFFPSASQARKAGWTSDIPKGWSEVKLKKARTVVFVWRAEAVIGLITTKHLITHCGVIVKEFGWRVWFRCWWLVLTRRNPTFLEAIKLGGKK